MIYSFYKNHNSPLNALPGVADGRTFGGCHPRLPIAKHPRQREAIEIHPMSRCSSSVESGILFQQECEQRNGSFDNPYFYLANWNMMSLMNIN